MYKGVYKGEHGVTANFSGGMKTHETDQYITSCISELRTLLEEIDYIYENSVLRHQVEQGNTFLKSWRPEDDMNIIKRLKKILEKKIEIIESI